MFGVFQQLDRVRNCREREITCTVQIFAGTQIVGQQIFSNSRVTIKKIVSEADISCRFVWRILK